MKKTLFIYISVLAIVCACSKTEVPAGESVQKEQEEIVVPEGYVLYQLSTDRTKVAIGGDEGKTLSWEEDDEIKLVTDKGKYTSQSIEVFDDGSAKFTFSIQEGDTPLYGVYPATIADGDITVDNDKLKVKFPTDDGIVASFSNSNVMCGKVNDGSIAFKNVAHLIKFTIGDALSGVTGIQICNLDGTAVIGEVSVGFTDSGVNVTPTGSEKVISKAVNGAGTYYIAVLPADDDSKWSGIGIRTVTESKDTGFTYSTGFIFASNIPHKSNAITNLGTIDSRFNTEVSVTDITKLNKVLDTEDNIAKIWYLNKKTLNLGANTTYTLTQSFEIKNTKVNDGITFTIQGAGKDNTIIDGNEKYRFLYVTDKVGDEDYNKYKTIITINDVTIQNCRPKGAGGAISIKGKGNDNKATLTINDSNLVKNAPENNSTTTTPNHNGGVIYATSYSDVVVTGCTFTENVANNGASIYSAGTATVTATGCDFVNGVAAMTGGAVNVAGSGKQKYENCKFISCSSEGGSGGAIRCNTANAKMEFIICNFIECKGYTNGTGDGDKAGGAISLGAGTIDIEGCTFDGNEGKSGAVFNLENQAALLRVNNSVFTNNKCKSRGLIRLDSKSAIFLNNCSFYQNQIDGQWGTILQGSNELDVACFNNCTIYENNAQNDTQKDGVCIHNSGHTIVTNSTIVNKNSLCLLRNDKNTDKRILVANSILLNTYLTTGKVFADGNMKATCNTYYCYLGKASYEPTNWSSSGDKKYITSLTGGQFDDVNLVYLWDGPQAADEFTKATEDAVKGYLTNMTVKSGNTGIGSNAAFGPAFATWVASVGVDDSRKNSFTYDALGNERTPGGTWPGAIEKH